MTPRINPRKSDAGLSSLRWLRSGRSRRRLARSWPRRQPVAKACRPPVARMRIAVSDRQRRNRPPTPCGAAGSPPRRAPSWRRSTPRSASTGASRGRISHGSIAHSAMLAAQGIISAGRPGRDPCRACGRSLARDRGRHLRLLDGPRRHPHERREPPQGDRRRAGRPPAYRRAAATTRSPSTCASGCATPTTAPTRS